MRLLRARAYDAIHALLLTLRRRYACLRCAIDVAAAMLLAKCYMLLLLHATLPHDDACRFRRYYCHC